MSDIYSKEGPLPIKSYQWDHDRLEVVHSEAHGLVSVHEDDITRASHVEEHPVHFGIFYDHRDDQRVIIG